MRVKAPAGKLTRIPTRARQATDFEREVLPLTPELFACALRYTRQPAEADDLVQETLLRALGAWSRFIPGSNCRAWLLRILTNSFINNYRRRRRYRRFAHETGDDAVNALYGNDVERATNPQRHMHDETLGDEVSAALASLGEDYRRVVELADLQGIRYREIAEMLGVPIGTVMSRLFRARRVLEEQLREYAATDHGIKRAA
jgi:RNA polymerase sigma-70 factor (ECF subfamily)